MKRLLITIALFFLLLAPVYFILADEGSTVTLNNPVQDGGEGTGFATTLFGRIIEFILGITGSAALIMFVYGGLTMITASGEQKKIDKGKEIITWAIIGLIVIFASYSIVSFILKYIQ